MSRFEMVVTDPESVQFDLRATFTLAQWREVSQAVKAQNAYGPAYQLVNAIDDMVRKANVDYRAWPCDTPQALPDGAD